MFEDLSITNKQRHFLQLLEDPTINELLIGGAGGGAKSFSLGMGATLLARKYPGVRIFIGRKTLKSLKQSTINTLLTKVFPFLGLKPDDYWMRFSDMSLEYKNGSKLIFGELDTNPSDPDFARIGSTEYDIAIVDEAGEITLQAKNAIKTRIGRGVLAEYGVPGKLIVSCNPSTNFLFSEYYEPYEKLGGGGFQKWQIGETTVFEGTEYESKLPSYRAFLRMGAYDNPFLPQSYIDNLKTLPDRERKRILDGNWHYADDENSLFRSALLDKATIWEIPASEDNNIFIGVDLSDSGKDKTIFSLIKNGILMNQKASNVQMNWEKESKLPMGRLITDELVEFAQRNGIDQRLASHIAVEINGVGASVRDFLRERGWHILEYTATHKSRSENYYNLMMDMDSGDIKIYHEINDLDGLRRELGAHSYEMINQEPSVVKKEKIKATVGHSPDRADSFAIANYARRMAEHPELNPRTNRNRVIF